MRFRVIKVFGRQVFWRFEYKVADAWVGAYWKQMWSYLVKSPDIWVCVVPCVPLHVRVILRVKI